MAFGLDIVVPFAGDPDPTLPYASSIDARETPGSILLIEPSHSYLPWAAGVPANGAMIPNVVWENAARVIGSGDVTSTRSLFENTYVPGEGVFERTAKGGLHGVVSRTAQGGHRAHLQTEGIMPYLEANPTRPLALFIWGRVTRPATSTSTSSMFDGGIGDAASFAGKNYFQARFTNDASLQRLSYSAPTGRTGAAQSQPRLWAAAWGNMPPYNSTIANDGRSFILYSFHLVDVLASGMTYAQLDAMDAAAYAEAFGAGGRFAGDTWTDPATLIAA